MKIIHYLHESHFSMRRIYVRLLYFHNFCIKMFNIPVICISRPFIHPNFSKVLQHLQLHLPLKEIYIKNICVCNLHSNLKNKQAQQCSCPTGSSRFICQCLPISRRILYALVSKLSQFAGKICQFKRFDNLITYRKLYVHTFTEIIKALCSGAKHETETIALFSQFCSTFQHHFFIYTTPTFIYITLSNDFVLLSPCYMFHKYKKMELLN